CRRRPRLAKGSRGGRKVGADASSPVPVRTVPRTWRGQRGAAAVLAGVVAGWAVYADPLFLVANKARYCYFPPFLPHIDDNGVRGLGGEYFHIAQALAAGQGFSHPFRSRTGPTAWQTPVLPAFLACLLWLSGGSQTFVVAVIVCLNVLVLIG